MNRRSDLRVRYLLAVYRALADVAHRSLDPGSDNVQKFEQGLADIQLLENASRDGGGCGQVSLRKWRGDVGRVALVATGRSP